MSVLFPWGLDTKMDELAVDFLSSQVLGSGSKVYADNLVIFVL